MSDKLDYALKELVFYFRNTHASLFALNETTSMEALGKTFIKAMNAEIMKASAEESQVRLSAEFLGISKSQLAISKFLQVLRTTVHLFTPMVQTPVADNNDLGHLYTAWVQETALAMPK